MKGERAFPSPAFKQRKERHALSEADGESEI
jgi:hypothetical protein